jgi:imidazolonepropionase
VIVSVDLVIKSIGELATAASSAGPVKGTEMKNLRRVKDACIAITAGKITAVGSEAEVFNGIKAGDYEVIDAGGMLATAGLVDPHTHLIFDGNRANEFLMRCQGKTYSEIAEAGGGIVASMRATRASSRERLVQLGAERLQRMLEAGTTTCEVKTGYGLDKASELNMFEAILELKRSCANKIDIVPTFMPAHAVPPGSDREEYVDHLISAMIPEASRMVPESEHAYVDVFCDRGYFTLDDTRRIFAAASAGGFKLKVHSDEFVNLGATALATTVGADSADHLLNISDAEIAAMADSSTVAVLLPGTSFYLNLHEHARARTMIDAGVAVALGSDFNPGSCHIFSLPLIWGLACLHLKMTVEEALTALTVNSAYAIGMGEVVGRLSPGYQADITLFNVGALEEVPYNLGWNSVHQVIKKGRVAFSK